MILERLHVEGFRHLTAPYDFVPDERLTIISAPNGSGKSTLLDALYHGLLEKHTVSGTVASERLLSRGRTLVPRITIDFRAGNNRYRLRKHFLRDKLSKLDRWEAGRYVPLCEDTASDDFVRELFTAAAPVRGAVDAARHWGLGHILWSPNSVQYAAVPGAAADHVRSMLTAASIATPGERAVEQRIAERYERYFTETGALARSAGSANLPALDIATAAARAAVSDAATNIEQLDYLRGAYERSSSSAAQIGAERTAVRQQLEDTKILAARFDELATQRRLGAAEEERWHEHSRAIKARIDGIAALQTRRAALHIKHNASKAALDAIGARVSAAGAVLATATGAVEAAASLVRAVQVRAADVTAASDYVRAVDDFRRSAARIARIDSDARDIVLLERRRKRIAAPTKVELKLLREIDIERRSLEAAIAVTSLALEIRTEVDMPANVAVGDRTGALLLGGGNAHVVSGSDQIVVIVPGFGRITARGADSAAAARSKHATLSLQLRAALERLQAASLAELEARADRAGSIENEIAVRRRSHATSLDGGNLIAIRRHLQDVQAQIDAIERRHPAWREHQPDAHGLRAAFDRDLQVAVARERTAAARRQPAEAQHAAALCEHNRTFAAHRDLEREDEQHATRLQDLRSDGPSDTEREAALADSLLHWTAARRQRENLDVALDAFGRSPHDTRKALELHERELSRRYEEQYGRAQRALALLEEFAHRGTYRQLAEAEEVLAALVEQQRIERAEADAIGLLSSAFHSARQQRIEAVLAPVQTRASALLARIAGPSLGAIEIASDLTPAGVRGRQHGDFVEIASTLSTGEREQIYMATRLAIADVIAGSRGRQLFVLDDILTGTDPIRLSRFIAILQEFSRERLQIIVTTTDANRYLGIVDAKHIDLRAALALADAA